MINLKSSLGDNGRRMVYPKLPSNAFAKIHDRSQGYKQKTENTANTRDDCYKVNRTKMQTFKNKQIQAIKEKKSDSQYYPKQSLKPSEVFVTYFDEELHVLDEPNDDGDINPINLPAVLQSQPNTQRNKIQSTDNTNLYIEKSERSEKKENIESFSEQVPKKKSKPPLDLKKRETEINIGENMNSKSSIGAKDKPSYNSAEGFQIVAAIDFGTTFSGYAFQTTSEHASNPLSITTKRWLSPQYCSVKTSSCILFDPYKRFHSFGFDAEEKYLRLLKDKDDNAESWYYFNGFKMILYQNVNINNKTKIKDNHGKYMPALKVFSAALGYLKADLLGLCFQQHPEISIDQIRWVITVPALWNDKAKTFMREAARKAGISSSNLIMALEPEAASLYCIEWMKKSDAAELGRKENFLVLDAGGGTVDIAVHQIQENGRIKELHKANGGDWGGMKVDQEFRKLLQNLMSREVFGELEKTYTSDFITVFQSFERAKRRDFSAVAHGKVQISFPSIVNQLCMKTCHRNVNQLVTENETLRGKLRLIHDKLEIDLTLFNSLFSNAIIDVLNHMSSLFRHANIRDISTVFMVGGYSECYLLQEAIKRKFVHLNILVPPDSAFSILKGAVLYGHSPRTFQSRISTFTYGIETTEPFDRNHPVDKKICINGSFHCDKVFCIHVRDGENVTIGKSVSKLYKTIDPKQTHMEFIVFASTKFSPKYTDENGCFQLGILTVDVSKMITDKHGAKKVRLELIYGGTELEAVATDITTGKTSREHFNLKTKSK